MGRTVLAEVTFRDHSQPTSRSNSSGPVRGNKMAGSASIPGASFVEGETVTCSVSGESMALWAGTWKAQFLFEVSGFILPRGGPSPTLW